MSKLKLDRGLLSHSAKLTHIALEGVELPVMLDRIVRYLRRTFAIELAEITLLDLEHHVQRISAQAGRSILGLKLGDGFPLDKGLTSQALMSARAVYAPDVSRARGFVRSSKDCQSNLVLPIRRRVGKQVIVLGAINLESKKLDGFSQDTRILLEALADQLAGAIHLAQLNAELAKTSSALSVQAQALAKSNLKLQRANRRLLRLSTLDSLTGLANHREFHAAFKREWARALRGMRPLTLVLCDADHFKAFNDRHGHRAGDRALQNIAKVLKAYSRRAGELAGRVGGEEFAVLLPEMDHIDASRYGEALRAAVAGLSDATSVSIGIFTQTPTRGDSHELWFKQADLALYQAKRAGRNCVRLMSG